jgi:hypothetical protein
MRYCDALKFSVTLFNASVLNEPATSETTKEKNKHYSYFRPVMIIVEHIIAGPKTIINGSASTDIYGDVILRYYFKNYQMKYPITSIEVTASESPFASGANLIPFFPTHIKPFESNVNERLIEQYNDIIKTPTLAELQSRLKMQTLNQRYEISDELI